jgi:hypothetical protein
VYPISAPAALADSKKVTLSGFTFDRSLRHNGDILIQAGGVLKAKPSVFGDTSNDLAITFFNNAP